MKSKDESPKYNVQTKPKPEDYILHNSINIKLINKLNKSMVTDIRLHI